MIEIQNLTICFKDKTVLQRFNAELPDSGCVVIRGESGIGKTTLLRALAGTLRPNEGAVFGVTGRRISVAFQEPRLLPWKTALENVAMVSSTERAVRYLTRLSMQKELYQKAKNLSGGQQQRVSLARAFAYGTDIVLLDEPFNGLDEQNRLKAAALFREAKLCIAVLHHDEDELFLQPNKKIML